VANATTTLDGVQGARFPKIQTITIHFVQGHKRLLNLWRIDTCLDAEYRYP
jgi:hypothetical protein